MKTTSYGLILRLFVIFVGCVHIAGQSAFAYAMDEIGWAILYQDSATWRTKYVNLESWTSVELQEWQWPAWVYRNEWYVFNTYDPNLWQQAYFYKKHGETEPRLLFRWGWLNFFDSDTGNFAYETYDQATMIRKIYASNINQTEATMVLDLPDSWISSWSPDMTKYVYAKYDQAAWISRLRLRKTDWSEDVPLSVTYWSEGNVNYYVSYRFLGKNDELVKTTNRYDYDAQTSTNAVKRVAVSDFQNLVETAYDELGILNNSYIVWYRGDSTVTSTWNTDWTNTYRFVGWSLWGIEYVSANWSWAVSDYNTGRIGWFWDYFAFSRWDQATSQNVVDLVKVRTGEKSEILRGGYVWASSTYFEAIPPCIGDYLTCGKSFSSTEEWKFLRRWGANGFIGYVWSFQTEQTPISKWIPNGFVWTANTNDWSDVTFANVWFFGSQMTEDWKNMFMANVGFVGTNGDMDWSDYFVAKSGYLWNAWTEDWNDMFTTKSWYLWGVRTWSFETKNTFVLGSFRSNWKDWVWNGAANPQFEKPEGKDDDFLAYATESPWEATLVKGYNQATRAIQQLVDQIDPVELSTGEFTYDNTVLRLAGAVMPFELSVKYRSRITYDGPLGWNWSHSYDQKLVADEYGRMTYVDGWLQNFTFETFGDGYQYLKWLEASLVKNADGTFEMAFKNWGRKKFDAKGMLTRIEDADGNGLDLAYDAQSRLTTVTDALWRPVTYSYWQNGRISKVSDPLWRSASFEYLDGTAGTGSLNDLASITIDNWPEAKKTVSFTYSAGGTDDTDNHNLLTLTDSKGQEYVRNEYRPDDRVATQWFWDGSGRFSYETADVHSDDTPESVWTGPAVWTRVTKTVATNKRGVNTEYAFDRMGNVLSRTTYDLAGSGTTRTAFEYDSVGRLLKETRPMGGWTVWKYDSNGNRTEERKKENASAPDNDLTDIVSTFEYGTGATDKLVTKSVAPDGTATRYEYDSKRRLVKTVAENVVLSAWSGGVNLVSTMEYDLLWRLSKTSDPLGRSTEFAYSGGLLVSTKKVWTGTGEILETVEYDAFWNPVKTTDGEGYASTAEYDAFWRVTLARSPGWLKKRSAYDANDNRVWESAEVAYQKWKNVNYSYDLLDKPVAVAEDVGDWRTATGTTAYDPNGNVAETAWPDAVRKTYSYDAQDRMVSWTESDGNLVRGRTAEYDRDGNLTKKTDANGNAWTYSYDGFGRAVSSVSPEGTETRVAYDKLGNAVRTAVLGGTGIAASSSSTVFNAFGKPLSVTAYDPLPDGSSKLDGAHRTAKTEYDADWSVAAAYDPEGNRTAYSYDGFGRLSAVRDALGNEIRTTYDRRGLVTKSESVGSDGKTVSAYRTYDPDGRLAETRQSEGGTELVTAYSYDGLGNVTEKTDAEGRKTSYSYDFRGSPLSETDAMGGMVSRTYDLAGRKVSQTDAEGRTTSYSYGKFGTLSSETLPDGSAYSWTYDLAGNAVSSSDLNGNSVTTAYDRENRPVRKEALAGSGVLGGWTLSYSYDAAWRLVSATGTDGKVVSYSYDPFGGILSETSDGKTVTRTYGARGLETSATLPSGRTVSRAHDALWRTVGISSSVAGGSSESVASYSYAGNFLSSVAYGNGASESRSYDAFGRLAALTVEKADSTKIKDWTYSYDKVWNPLSDGTDVWSYDPLHRLKDVSYGTSGSGTGLPSPETFAHSANGNRTSRGFANADGTSSGSTSYYANQLDQYVSIEKSGNSGTGSDAYSYDLNGNLVETSRYRFAYDWSNRLVRVTEKARTVLVGTWAERKEVWIGSETGSGTETGSGVEAPPAEPPATEPPPEVIPPPETPPAETGTWTETPPESGTGSETWTGTEMPPETGTGETSTGSVETGSGTETGTWSAESGTGTETPPETWTWTEMPPESGTGSESWSGTETWSGTESWTGGTSSGTTAETQSGATASGATESGPTVTEITYPERLIAEYAYDVFGRRVSKTLPDRVVSYSYDGQMIIEETVTDFSGTVLRSSEFVYWASGDDDVLAEFRTESWTTAALHFAKDRLGSTASVSDSSGNVLEEYRYSAFWSPYRKLADGSWEALWTETETLSGTVRPEPLTGRLYTGREWDSETGLHYYRARTYSPELWRFLQRDPVGTADQMNPYAYVRNNPMMWTDPTGMISCPITEPKKFLKEVNEMFSWAYRFTWSFAYRLTDNQSFGYLDYKLSTTTGAPRCYEDDEYCQGWITSADNISKLIGLWLLYAWPQMVSVGGWATVLWFAACPETAWGWCLVWWAGVALTAWWVAVGGYGGSNLLYMQSRSGSSWTVWHEWNPNHLNSGFLGNQNKVKPKNGRPRYDNGSIWKERQIYEWDSSHWGEIEVYDGKWRHIWVMNPNWEWIKSAVQGRKITP